MSSRVIKENQKLVLSLYRRCLRSALQCPKFSNREMMLKYTRSKFGDNKEYNVKDFDTVELLLKQGEEELTSMNQYHQMRELKKKGEEPDHDKIFGVDH
ncbi:hypothetical protein DFA_10311 [Cavenderia fasciculata]|uniref:Complex 1 LYR protein domain-containing protein n=1 Tax=Cavenderia fasciculata TaxID=261658 RepID=F4Q9V3_CACFS|nr:uncharacterized protein DFA_10311 [Cavenderia fasciculata]EGG15472.1 hypothetical protein DFA_10311 [Cavenderia fasciculata]|eukprot:XP_004354214.1 hypothetical protein DFA_10311 [Cavenderia fasciculata]